jgi:hypothetical protein
MLNTGTRSSLRSFFRPTTAFLGASDALIAIGPHLPLIGIACGALGIVAFTFKLSKDQDANVKQGHFGAHFLAFFTSAHTYSEHEQVGTLVSHLYASPIGSVFVCFTSNHLQWALLPSSPEIAPCVSFPWAN